MELDMRWGIEVNVRRVIDVMVVGRLTVRVCLLATRNAGRNMSNLSAFVRENEREEDEDSNRMYYTTLAAHAVRLVTIRSNGYHSLVTADVA